MLLQSVADLLDDGLPDGGDEVAVGMHRFAAGAGHPLELPDDGFGAPLDQRLVFLHSPREGGRELHEHVLDGPLEGGDEGAGEGIPEGGLHGGLEARLGTRFDWFE